MWREPRLLLLVIVCRRDEILCIHVEVGTQRVALLGRDSVERVHTSFGYALFPLILMCQPISEKRVLQLDGVGHDIDEVFVLHRFS